MRKVAIINLKGGVGKTTSTINIAFALASKEKRVLLIDLDPQANLSLSLFAAGKKTAYDLLINEAHVSECIIKYNENVDIIPSKDLDKAELAMAGLPNRENILKKALEPVFNYDFVFIDCPPSNSLLNYNALLYASEAFVPVSTDYLGISGLRKVIEMVESVRKAFGHPLNITGVIPTMFDQRSRACKESLAEIKKGFNGEVLSEVRVNSTLKEVPKKGVSIFEYDRKSRGAKDYMKIADEILDSRFQYF
jgi:chromosome partitioning protein